MRDGLFKRSDSKIWWTRIGGQKISTGTDDREAARTIRANMLRKQADPAYNAENETTFARAAQRCLEHLKTERKVAEATLSFYTGKMGHLCRLIGDETTLNQVTAQTVDEYIKTRTKEGAHTATIGKELLTLSQTLKVARRDLKFTRPLDTIMPIRFSHGSVAKDRFLTPEEYQKLIAVLTPNRAAYVAFSIAVAGRKSDVERSKRSDIRQKEEIISVVRKKRKNSMGELPIVAPALIELTLKHADGKDGKLFSDWDNINRDLYAACKRAGIPRISTNDLRRTMASWLMQAGAPPHVIAKFIGHTGGSALVEKVYGRLDVESLRKLIPDLSRFTEKGTETDRDKNGTSHPEKHQTTATNHLKKIVNYRKIRRRGALRDGLWLRMSRVQIPSITQRFRIVDIQTGQNRDVPKTFGALIDEALTLEDTFPSWPPKGTGGAS